MRPASNTASPIARSQPQRSAGAGAGSASPRLRCSV
ncbi:Uncharacterised protein [Bordetella pertussis]|nr:Uncharacterised protein [Bordetella pertussis]